jgi:hypothetical protein
MSFYWIHQLSADMCLTRVACLRHLTREILEEILTYDIFRLLSVRSALDGSGTAVPDRDNRRWVDRVSVGWLAEIYRDRLAGAVIIDPSNPSLWHDDGVITIKDPGGKTSGTVTAELFPKSLVSRAFSHQLAETLWLRGCRQPGRWGIGYATDDNDTACVTAEIITQTGFVPVRVGTLVHSAPIDPGGVLFPGLLGLFSPQSMRTTLFRGPFRC